MDRMRTWLKLLIAAGIVVLAWLGCFSSTLLLVSFHACGSGGEQLGQPGPFCGLAQALALLAGFGAPLFGIAAVGCLIAALIAYFASRHQP